MIQRYQLMVWSDLTEWRHVDQWPDKTAKDGVFEVFTRLADWTVGAVQVRSPTAV